jgi:hypothetical protein
MAASAAPNAIGEPVYRLSVKGGRAKGLAHYSPRAGSKAGAVLSASLAVLDRYRQQERLPLGPREVGYLLTGDEHGYAKADIDIVEDVLVRARRAGRIAWEEISDGRTAAARPWEVQNAEALADSLLEELGTAQLDRQEGQPYRVEVWAEAAGWLARLEGICNERGVPVYSGSGSVPVSAIRALAIRALRAFQAEQRLVVLSLGDLDLNGLRNIARPFEADLHAFIRDMLVSDDFDLESAAEAAEAIAPVRRLLLSPDQVLEHIGKRAWGQPTSEYRKADWPWPFWVQAEALAPEIRDNLVIDAIDSLHDTTRRARLIESESELHEGARRALARRLDNEKENQA